MFVVGPWCYQIIYKHGDPTGLEPALLDLLQTWRPYGPRTAIMGFSTNMADLRASNRRYWICYKHGGPTGLEPPSWNFLQTWRPYGPRTAVMEFSANMAALRASNRRHGIFCLHTYQAGSSAKDVRLHFLISWTMPTKPFHILDPQFLSVFV